MYIPLRINLLTKGECLMWRLSVLLIGLFLSVDLQAQAAVVEQVVVSPAPAAQVIVTPTPAPKEVVVTPTGYVNCFTVAAGWYKDIWVPEHKICQYEKSTEGVAWVEGYWACDKHAADGVCTNWDWKPGRWVKALEVY